MDVEHPNIVHCKSCGASMDVNGDEPWQLQCPDCKRAGAELPDGYDDLKGGEHDAAT